MIIQYLTLEALATILALPRTYLRDLANQGQIPYLDVNGRKRFIESEVRGVLAKRAAKGGEVTHAG